MNDRIPSPFLLFDFTDENGCRQPLLFRDPIQIFAVYSIEDVYPTLCAIQMEVNKGLYAAGFLTYEAAPAFDPAFSAAHSHKLPLAWFGIFQEPLQEPHAVLAKPFAGTGEFHFMPWESTVSKEEYASKMQRIKDAIGRGETYQLNYTMRLRSHFSGDDFAYYQLLRAAQKGNYSAYLNIGSHRILSASPELFFHVKDRQVATRPMKGTAKRGRWFEEDQEMAAWLQASDKNRAENVMIVDLLRNDIGRIAETGSVHVPALFELERYPTVFQLTSTVVGQLHTHATWIDVLQALFPCGSITGAPKIRTMELISEWETAPRELYCGTIGLIKPNGNAVFNVAIRTMILDAATGMAEYGVGGGITWDSAVEEEYVEAFAKAALLTEEMPTFELLETLKMEQRNYILFKRHLERLQKSAQYFAIPLDLDHVKCKLTDYANSFSAEEVRRVRLLVTQSGQVRIESTPLPAILAASSGESKAVALAQTAISKNNRFLYHKTTHRSMYEAHRSASDRIFDVLLWNEDEEITEFINGNVVVQIDGQKLTPPVACGLLPGTMRAQLLADGRIEEKRLTRSDIRRAEHIWFINSVRGCVPVHLEE
ncbi:aminodeoxychorismate synthase component I [Fodinisporobacter ferrooxydans]|uniref:Aminodeoxychorismate synthase component I n=1 Tax=Fodinisporobacter ferrooxydans TaxID=2901836 RepID=A0ABY4CP87_9BACL|nr:aminodeoxychorismate synthase component I [Alicyclobacillaceae bacterium MYW30-H2]